MDANMALTLAVTRMTCIFTVLLILAQTNIRETGGVDCRHHDSAGGAEGGVAGALRFGSTHDCVGRIVVAQRCGGSEDGTLGSTDELWTRRYRRLL
jgi:hypothetical protein